VVPLKQTFMLLSGCVLFIYKMKYLKRMGRTDPNGIMLPSLKCGCLLLLHGRVVQTH